MRQLILLRGPMAAGKSTFVRQHGLEPYTLSIDNIRSMYAGPIMKGDGQMSITGEYEKKVWGWVNDLLEIRMRNGDFTVIDATHVKTTAINKYRDLCKEYRYRCTIVEFRDNSLAQLFENNETRADWKFVPRSDIENAYERMQTEHRPSWVNYITPEEFPLLFKNTPGDYSQWTKIHHIGDTHGSATALRQFFEYNGGIKDDELYIFTGDYLDRGLENLSVLAFCLENYKRKNFIFLEGNHEKHLKNWAHGEETAKTFEHTKEELERAEIDLKEVRQFIRKLRQCVYYSNGHHEVFVTHGGLSRMPDSLDLIATNQLINGSGTYEDDVDEAWHANNPEIIQIHGHRNIFRLPTQASPTSFNLEGRVEHGGDLRTVQLIGPEIEVISVKNPVFKKQLPDPKPVLPKTVGGVIDALRESRDVNEFGCTDRISSFNFTERAFKSGNWNDISVRARGLFIDVVNERIVSRSYDKFFNIGERHGTRLADLSLKLQYPLTGYTKPNGYLGIVGYDQETDKLVFSSKSQINGVHAQVFKQLFEASFDEKTQHVIKTRMKQRPSTTIFEVIHPEFDPHIIKYNEPKLVLLDMIENQIEFKRRMSYEKLVDFANLIGCEIKQQALQFNSWLEFYSWYKIAKYDTIIEQEGYVFEDASGFMFKFKLPYYKMWKELRGVKSKVERKQEHAVRTGSLVTPVHNRFFAWLKKQDKDTLKGMSIIQARDAFFENDRLPRVPEGVLTREKEKMDNGS